MFGLYLPQQARKVAGQSIVRWQRIGEGIEPLTISQQALSKRLARNLRRANG